ncbi:MAG: hypothetical protein R2713_16395 [Ilumatobacteraceae bacterium]
MLGGGVLARRRPSAAAVGARSPPPRSPTREAAAVAATPPPIEGAATVAAPAERLGLGPTCCSRSGPNHGATCSTTTAMPARAGVATKPHRHPGRRRSGRVRKSSTARSSGRPTHRPRCPGNSLRLTADDGVYYFFAHLSAFAEGLQVGDRVRSRVG